MRMPAGLIASAVCAAAILANGGPALPADRLEPALWSRLQRIEAAFREGDAEGLRASFSSEVKVRVEIDRLAEAGAYGPKQLQVVFAGVFERCATREFAFRRAGITVSSPGTAFAPARWLRACGAGDPAAADAFTFTLRQEGPDWRIQEIVPSR